MTARSVRPARLVKITRLDGTIKRIADAQSDVTISGDGTYTPVAGCELKAVKHGLNGMVPSSQMDFAHSSDGFFVSRDIVGGLYDGASVVIYLVNRSDLSATPGLLFAGTIQGVAASADGAGSFTFKGFAANSETFIRTFNPMCDTDLFSPLCQLSESAFDVDGTVTAIVDRYNATISLVSPPADFYFNDGVGRVPGKPAFKIANWFQSSGQLTTYRRNSFLFDVGDTVTLWPGCDKRYSTCRDKFSNTINFQGFPHYLGALAASVQN